MAQKAWLYQYKDPDPYRWDKAVYKTAQEAYEAVAVLIRSLAKDELFEIGDDPSRSEEAGLLREALRLTERHKTLKEAYETWREYADDVEPSRDVLIEEVDYLA